MMIQKQLQQEQLQIINELKQKVKQLKLNTMKTKTTNEQGVKVTMEDSVKFLLGEISKEDLKKKELFEQDIILTRGKYFTEVKFEIPTKIIQYGENIVDSINEKYGKNTVSLVDILSRTVEMSELCLDPIYFEEDFIKELKEDSLNSK